MTNTRIAIVIIKLNVTKLKPKISSKYKVAKPYFSIENAIKIKCEQNTNNTIDQLIALSKIHFNHSFGLIIKEDAQNGLTWFPTYFDVKMTSIMSRSRI